MKKISLIVQSKDAVATLDVIRDLEIMHIEPQRIPISTYLTGLKDDIKILMQAIDVLKGNYISSNQVLLTDCMKRAKELLEVKAQIDYLTHEISRWQVQINVWKPWGEFEPDDIRQLANQGLYVELYEIPISDLKKIPENIIFETVFVAGSIARCIVISQDKGDLPFAKVVLPEMSLSKMQLLQREDQKSIEALQRRIKDFCQYLETFQNGLSQRKEEVAFQEALLGLKETRPLVCLKGFCPIDQCERLRKAAQKEQWGLLIENPKDEDDVPTLLRNPRWIDIINPLLKMINIIPGYKELDISFFFLLFFSLFFGILIGDAGYGLFFALLTGIVQIKKGRMIKEKSIFALMYVLSGSAVVWGVLTGTYFGSKWLPYFIHPVLPELADSNNVQIFCFLIGAIHLSLAHLWRSTIKFPSLSFLGELGWVSMIWGMFFLAKMLILNDPLPVFTKTFFILGTALVVLFTQPHKNILKAIGAGTGSFFLKIVNTFTDVVSYIRLFAVGLATVAVADAFNELALGFGFNSIIAGLISAIILVLGHLFNIALGAMAILVHGLRLNVLEFSSHLNMEWLGIEYHPFRRIRQT